MQYEARNVFMPFISLIRCSSNKVTYSGCGLVQLNPISYIVIPGKSASVHVLTCLP